MKRAFTLAEVLITVGIVGVIAALVMPAISHLKPDKNKTAYLQAYDTITDTVKSLAGNSKLYPVCKDPEDADNINCAQYPLFNTNRPLDDRFNNEIYQGDRKLCSLMGWSLGVSQDNMNCSNAAYAFNAANYTNGFANASFTTKNGMRWRVVPAVTSTANDNRAQYQTDIYLDVDPTNNNVNGQDRSCIYNQDSCTQPDIFKFMVAANGDITPADPMGQEYITSRKSFLKKKYDIDNNVIASVSDDRAFDYSPCRNLTEEEQCIADGRHWYNDTCNACLEGQVLINGVCTAPGGGGGGGGGGDKCWPDASSWMSITGGQIVCNKTVNIWSSNITNGALVVRLKNGVATTPLNFSIPATKVDGDRTHRGTVGCSIPAGQSSCSVATDFTNINNVNTEPWNWVSPAHDGSNFYIPQASTYSYFRNIRP